MNYLNNNYINEGFIGAKLAKKRKNEYEKHVFGMKLDAIKQKHKDNLEREKECEDINEWHRIRDDILRDDIDEVDKYSDPECVDQEKAEIKSEIDKNKKKWNTELDRVNNHFNKLANNRQKHIENTENLLNKRVEATKNRSDLSYAKSYLKQGIRKLNRSKLGKTINNFGNKLGYKGKTINKKIKLREDVELYRYYREMV